MGHLIIRGKPLFTPGDDCTYCQDVSRHLWDAGETPEEIKAVFRHIQLCPPPPTLPEAPNNRLFCLRQSEVQACTWNYLGSVWEVSFFAGSPVSPHALLMLHHVPSANIVFASPVLQSPCTLEHTNRYTVCVPPNNWIGGSGTVWFHRDNDPQSLCNDYHFHPTERNIFEGWGYDEVLRSFRICSTFDKTNVQILVDKDHFP